MRHRQRKSLSELGQKAWQDTATASENVSEADTDEFDRPAPRRIANEQFAHALCRSHDARRVDGFVRRDEHETPRPVPAGSRDDVTGTGHVVLHRFASLQLDEVDVLVGRGVEDDLGTVPGKRLIQPGDVEDVAEERYRHMFIESEQHFMETVLVPLQHRQRGAAEGDELPAELRADRAPCAGDENAPSFHECTQGRQIGPDRSLWQQVTQVESVHRVTSTRAISSASTVQTRPTSSSASLP